MFFQRHRQILAGPLRGRLRVISAHGFLRALHRWRSGWRNEQARHDTADDRAVKTFVIGQVGQYRIRAPSAHCELDGTFAQSFLQFIKIEIVPAARVADNDDGLGIHAPACRRPEILVVVQRGTVTDRATIELPYGRGSDNDEHDNDCDPAPGHRRDRPLVFERRTAMHALELRRLTEEQARQPKPAFKIGSR